ncbi:MAG: pilus assembly protein PilM [Bacillota bacterium]|nr:pilus assembly protein PilM [Bacillota bacterium]
MILDLFKKNDSILCIDVGYRNIKVLEVSLRKDCRVFVKKFGICKTPFGAIANGSIHDTTRIVQAIKNLITSYKMSAKTAKIIMSGTNIITRIYSIEVMPNETCDMAIKRTVSVYLPFLNNDYSVDYKILQTTKKDGLDICKVFATAVPRLVIQSYVKVLQMLDLKPLAIDIPGNSTAKFFNRISDISIPTETSIQNNVQNSDTFAVLDFGSETTIINIMQNRVLTFNKVILCGSSNIDEHIAKDLGVPIDVAEKLKMIYGLKLPDNESTQEHREVYESINNFVVKLTKQLISCIEFYQNRFQGNRVERIFITGGGSQLYGLDRYLGSVLNMPVSPVYSLDLKGVDLDKNIEKNKLTFMTNSLGISL